MKIIISLFITLLIVHSNSYAEQNKRVTDRDSLCAFDFGIFDKNNAFVSSTPMQDACLSNNYESRKRICEFNYKKREVINACIATYDSISFQIEEAKAHNKSLNKDAK